MKCPYALLLAAISFGSHATERVDSVPLQFLGEWNSDVTDCGTGQNDSVLLIRPSHIRFWESSGPIKAVVTTGEQQLFLIVELTGEGETWTAAKHFRLEQGGVALVDVSDHGGEFVRFRCPVSGGSR